MPNVSLGNKLKEWRRKATAAAANESDLPFAKEMQAELVAAADTVESLSNQQAVLKAQFQQNTRDLEKAAKRANDLSTRLGGGIRWAYGLKAEKLTEFGLKPRRPPLRSTAQKSASKKSKETASAVTPAADSTT
jgi:hypothetical protein